MRTLSASRSAISSVAICNVDEIDGNLPYGVTKGALDRLVLASAHELADAGVRATSSTQDRSTPAG